jgi:hypothetical protein
MIPRKRKALFLATIAIVVLASAVQAQIDPSILPPVGYHPSEVTYFNAPYLSNSMLLGGEWREFSGTSFGTTVPFYNETTQFVNGYPQTLGAGGTPNQRGPRLRALLFGKNINNTDVRPAGWPVHDTLGQGRYTLTWTGAADIQLEFGTFVPEASTPGLGETGISGVNGGMRVYDCAVIPETLEVLQIGAGGIQSIKVWLPAVDDPATGEQENMESSLVDQFFHPIFLERIADADWGFIRFMDWGKTNASPQMDWVDRRIPNHVFQFGIINDRAPNNQGFAFGDRETRVAWEHMVALSNATGKDLWINVPHLATEDYMTRLARLIRFGSDGVNPFTSVQANPPFPPLNSNLKVYVEFSNEIWSSGGAFPQGNWAEEEAATLGITKPQFTARKFCDTWRIFQQEFGAEASRLVRVAAIFTANDTYSRAFMTEIGTYGATAPATRPDVLALTTYFGNDIQGFVNDQGFTSGKLFTDPVYWQSAEYKTHQHLTFDEWKRRILSGDSASGSGPDATGTSGGFDAALRDLARETLLTICPQDPNSLPCLPLVAYEGGPSIFTNDPNIPGMDGTNATTDDNVTIFMEAMNRDPRIADGYRMHLDLAKSKGLWTHTPYTDTSQWSRFGQWGHLELLEQDPEDSPKYSLMLEHHTLFSKLRHIDAPLNLVPSFGTSATLPTGIAAQSYGPTSILTTGGDGSRSVVVVGAFLDAGLSVSSPTADTLQISGTPITSRKNFILARVQDGDGDPAWRTFTLQTFGGPGTLVQSNLQGTSPALNLPWTPTFVLSRVNWSGWNKGSGIVAKSGNDAIFFSISAGGDPSTLTEAIADNEFLTATITPNAGAIDLQGAEVRFSIRRHDQHSPQSYSVFSSVGGFATEGAALFTGSVADEFDETETEFVFTIPNPAAAFSAINSAMEFRIYAFNGKFDDKQTSLTGFKLTTKNPLTVSGLSPSAGPTTSGQNVIITGVDLAGATSVTFGGTAGTITSNTATAINVTAPAGAAGTVNVVVTKPAAVTLTLTGAYRFVAAPTIGTIVSNSGSTNGIESVTITGNNLTSASVTFDGLPAPVTSNTATTLVVISPPHAVGSVNVVVTTAGGSATSTNGYTYAVGVPPAAPTGLVADSVSSFEVNLTWNSVAGATSYQVDRKSPGGSFTQFATPATNAVSDSGLTADTAFLYQVRAVSAGGTSSNSAAALATTVSFTDEPLVTGSTLIKRIHLVELRTAVNAVRTLAGIGTTTFTDPTLIAGTTLVKTIHVSELRTALSAAMTSLGFSAPSFSSGLATSSVVKQSHFQELRTLMK